MSTMLPDPSMMASQANQSDWLKKELEARRLQKEFNGGQTEEQKLRETTKGFESIFIQKLWQQMRKTVPKEGYLHSKEEDYYISMFDKDMAEKLADAGGIGLGDMLYNQLKQTMQDASRVTSPSGAEDKKPLQSLRPEYNPAALQPPEARNADLDTSLDAMAPNTELRPEDMGSFYAPVDGYEDAPGEDVPQGSAEEYESPWEQAAVSEHLDEQGQNPGRQQPEEAPGPILDPASQASVPGSAAELDQASAAYAKEQEFIQADPEVLAAVEALARRIAPQASPATRQQQTQLSGTQQAVNVSFQGEQQEVRLLGDGIKRKQGAMENEGGPEDVSLMPGLSRTMRQAQQASSAPAATAASQGPQQPMQWPVNGRLTSEFGWRHSPLTGERVFHEGVDLAASHGDPVRSCWDGTVTFAGKKPGYGNMLVVEHPGGWESIYAHSSKFSVKEGDTVKAGQEIASVGSTGRSTGPHLHFELRHEGAAYDPMKIHNSLAAGRANSRGA